MLKPHPLRLLASSCTLALALMLSALAACGGGGDDGPTCDPISTSGTWDLTINVPTGNPPVVQVTGLTATQNGCTATMTGGNGATTGTFNFSATEAATTCSFTFSGAQTASGEFTCVFNSDEVYGPGAVVPATSFYIVSGTSTGGAITGGDGVFIN